MVAGVGLAIGGLVTMFIHDKTESVANEFEATDRSTEAGRSAAVVEMERKFEKAAADERRDRKILGGISIGLGVANAGLFSYFLASKQLPNSTDVLYVGLVNCAILVAIGLVSFFVEVSVERAWHFYLQDSRLDTAAPPVTLAPNIGTTSTGSPLFGLSGTF